MKYSLILILVLAATTLSLPFNLFQRAGAPQDQHHDLQLAASGSHTARQHHHYGSGTGMMPMATGTGAHRYYHYAGTGTGGMPHPTGTGAHHHSGTPTGTMPLHTETDEHHHHPSGTVGTGGQPMTTSLPHMEPKFQAREDTHMKILTEKWDDECEPEEPMPSGGFGHGLHQKGSTGFPEPSGGWHHGPIRSGSGAILIPTGGLLHTGSGYFPEPTGGRHYASHRAGSASGHMPTGTFTKMPYPTGTGHHKRSCQRSTGPVSYNMPKPTTTSFTN